MCPNAGTLASLSECKSINEFEDVFKSSCPDDIDFEQFMHDCEHYLESFDGIHQVFQVFQGPWQNDPFFIFGGSRIRTRYQSEKTTGFFANRSLNLKKPGR